MVKLSLINENAHFTGNAPFAAMPGFPDYSAYLAAAAAAGLGNPAAQAAFAQASGNPFNPTLMAQQASQASSSSSSGPSGAGAQGPQHQRALSMGSTNGTPMFGTAPTIGLFPQHPGSPTSLINPFGSTQANGSANSILNTSQSPSAQAMSAMSSLSGGAGLSSAVR